MVFQKRCPPGVVCIENITLFILLITVLLLGAVYYFVYIPSLKQNSSVPSMPTTPILPQYNILPGIATRIGSAADIYRDPYAPPLKDDTIYMQPTLDVRGSVLPINVPTQAVDTQYRQVGILTRLNGKETILPIMGRPLFTNRDKWQYYAISDQNNSVKLPISNNKKSCTGEYGCDSLNNGDNVYVEGYNSAFKVTMYDNATLRYIPAI